MMSEMNSLIRAQHDLYGRIARAYENLKKLGTASITIGGVETRLLSLESNWTKFKRQNDVLCKDHWDLLQKHEYIQKDFAGLVEETYLQQKIKFMDISRTLKGKAKEHED